jgi:gamma-glutamylcysteine synthetase
MHRRIEIDWALSSMTPKAVPAAPLGLLARQCHADADVEAAAAIVAPTNIAMRKRLMIAPLFYELRATSVQRLSTHGLSISERDA